MSVQSLDDLPKADYAKAEKAILAFRASKIDADELYDRLDNLGLNSEYVGEFVQLEEQILSGEI